MMLINLCERALGHLLRFLAKRRYVLVLERQPITMVTHKSSSIYLSPIEAARMVQVGWCMWELANHPEFDSYEFDYYWSELNKCSDAAAVEKAFLNLVRGLDQQAMDRSDEDVFDLVDKVDDFIPEVVELHPDR